MQEFLEKYWRVKGVALTCIALEFGHPYSALKMDQVDEGSAEKIADLRLPFSKK